MIRQIIKKPILASTIFFFILGMGYRLFALFPPERSPDVTAYAVQSLHVLNGEKPLFYYGQKFMGTGGAFLIAGFYKLFGISYFSLHFFGWCMTFFSILLSLIFAYRLFGSLPAFFTSLFFLIPTRQLMSWAHKARPDYGLTFILVPLLLWLTYEVSTEVTFRTRKTNTLMSILGILSGFALWNNMLSGPLVLFSFFFLLIQYRRQFFGTSFLFYCSFFLIGFFPVILANIKMNFYIFHLKTLDTLLHLPQKLIDFCTITFPYFWGYELIYLKTIPWHMWLFLSWILILYVLYFRTFLKNKEQNTRKALILTGGYLGFHLLFAFITHFGKRFSHPEYPTAYIQNLYPVAFLIPSVVLAKSNFKPIFKTLGMVPLCFFLMNNAASTHDTIKDCISFIEDKKQEAFLHCEKTDPSFWKLVRERSLEAGYLEGTILNEFRFAEKDKMPVSDPYQEAFLPYSTKVDKSQNIFWGGYCSAELPKILEGTGLKFEQAPLSHPLGNIFFNFQIPHFKKNFVNSFFFQASKNNINTFFMCDRSIKTYWSTGGEQQKGDYLIIQTSEPVSELVIIPQNYTTFPSDFTIYCSTDEKDWEPVYTFNHHPGTVFYSGFHPFIKVVKPRMELRFPKPKGPYLKIEINKNGFFPFAIREVYAFRYKEICNEYDLHIKKILQTIIKKGSVSQVIGDHWFESYFFDLQYPVDFIPNRFIDNYGTENPHLKKLIPVDFSKPTWIISETPHNDTIARMLKENSICFQQDAFGCFQLFSTAPTTQMPSLYWDGIDLCYLETKNDYPPLKRLFPDCLKCKINFGDLFELVGYKIETHHEYIKFTFEIKSLTSISQDYYFFIHFCNNKNEILFQGDFAMTSYQGATSNWESGKTILMEKEVPIHPNVQGKLQIKTGIWHPAQKRNLKVNNSKDTRFELTSINL